MPLLIGLLALFMPRLVVALLLLLSSGSLEYSTLSSG
jgi:hypothetical protein